MVSSASPENEHRVATHLGVTTTEYDVQIRRWIPHYEEMLANVVEHLAPVVARAEAPVIVDMGAGTGALTEVILAAYPTARAILVDIDPNMLDAARVRLAPHASRVEVRRQMFAEPLPACDAVVASLALHHIPSPEAKRECYANIRAALRPGGALMIADATVHAEGAGNAVIYAYWARFMAAHGIAADEAAALFAQWAGEDTYQPLAVELSLLAAAGFPQPDAFWKRGPMTVYGGYAPAC